jgi:hypothetical protein
MPRQPHRQRTTEFSSLLKFASFGSELSQVKKNDNGVNHMAPSSADAMLCGVCNYPGSDLRLIGCGCTVHAVSHHLLNEMLSDSIVSRGLVVNKDSRFTIHSSEKEFLCAFLLLSRFRHFQQFAAIILFIFKGRGLPGFLACSLTNSDWLDSRVQLVVVFRLK